MARVATSDKVRGMTVSLYRALLRPLMFAALAPEPAHGLTLALLRARLAGRAPPPAPTLRTRIWGLDFATPVGVAAGFDKNAVAIDGLFDLGAGFVEIGTVTPRPQAGNPKPRIFRLVEDEGVINRLGFSGEGARRVADNLARFPRPRPGPLGINIGKNRDSMDAAADYGEAARGLASFADYLVVNVSSPNTPGLRALQEASALAEIVAAIRREIAPLPNSPALLFKIAPDLDAASVVELAAFAVDARIDGVIVGNTTLARPTTLRSRWRGEAGGLSGRPLLPIANEMLRRFYRASDGKVKLIGVGGIASGEDAYRKIRAGASLVQLYTAMIYRGPGLIARVSDELARLLARDGYSSPAAAVGVDVG